MKIIIVGCGNVGITLAEQLSTEGHNITVIDTREQVVEMNMMGNITDESGDYVHLMGQNLDALRDGLRK